MTFTWLEQYGASLIWGACNTLLLCGVCSIIGLMIGISCAELRRNGPNTVQWIVAAYVEIIRNTPFLVQLFFIFFGLPSLGVRIDAWTAALIAMSLNLGAYWSEIVRAGLEATSLGQVEAARALGLSKWLTFRKVVLPPAIGKVYTPMISQFLIVFLGSSVVSQISAEELTFQGQFIQSRTFRAFEVYLVLTIMYLSMAFSIKALFERARPRLFPWLEAR